MEIKAELIKPYTEEQRLEFIFQQNHKLDYEIKETETALEAWGYTDTELAEQREEKFNKQFFNTSLGYIRRNVNMANGSTKDFLSDLLPIISMALNINTPVTVIAYDEPPFDHDIEDWTPYQHTQLVTAQFIQECFLQLQNDFLPTNEG